VSNEWQDRSVPKRSSKTKTPRDPNALAAFIVAQATSEEDPEEKAEPTPEEAAHAAAVALGRLGGLKGGAARAKKLSKKKRSDIAKKAARARWAR
jgi:hypothetical protein